MSLKLTKVVLAAGLCTCLWTCGDVTGFGMNKSQPPVKQEDDKWDEVKQKLTKGLSLKHLNELEWDVELYMRPNKEDSPSTQPGDSPSTQPGDSPSTQPGDSPTITLEDSPSTQPGPREPKPDSFYEGLNCFEQLKEYVLREGVPENVNADKMNRMITMMGIADVRSLHQAREAMLATNIPNFLQEIAFSAADNPMLVEMCVAVKNDTTGTLRPHVENLGSLNDGNPAAHKWQHFEEVILFTIFIEEITKAISRHPGGQILRDYLDATAGNRPKGWRKFVSLFEGVKVWSVDRGAHSWAKVSDWTEGPGGEPGSQEQIQKKCCRGRELVGLRGNILEAMLEDVRTGFLANAAAASPMMLVQEEGVALKKWYKDLYGAWNMAFVSNKFGSRNMGTALAKLMAPSILGSSPDEYFFHRTVGLESFIHAEMVSRVNLETGRDGGLPVYSMDVNWYNSEFQAKFGEITKDFAEKKLIEEGSPLALLTDAEKLQAIENSVVTYIPQFAVFAAAVSGENVKDAVANCLPPSCTRAIETVKDKVGGLVCAGKAVCGKVKDKVANCLPPSCTRAIETVKDKVGGLVDWVKDKVAKCTSTACAKAALYCLTPKPHNFLHHRIGLPIEAAEAPQE
jgi:hypothetical protein